MQLRLEESLGRNEDAVERMLLLLLLVVVKGMLLLICSWLLHHVLRGD